MAVTLNNINALTGAVEGEYFAISYSLLKLRADESANTDGFLLTEGNGGSLWYKNAAGVLTAVDFASGAVVLRSAGLYINNVLVTAGDARLHWLSGEAIQNATDTLPVNIGNAFFVQALSTTSGTWGSGLAPSYSVSSTAVPVTVGVTPVNTAPNSVVLANALTSLVDNQDPVTDLEVADIQIGDDLLGNNTISLTGADAEYFKVTGGVLYLKAGTILDAAIKDSYTVTISVIDSTIPGSTAVNTTYTLNVIAPEPGTNTAPVVGVVGLPSIDEDSVGLTFSAGDLLANASDLDGDVLYVSNVALANAEAGTLTDNGNSTWTFVPAANFNGEVSFTYTVNDGEAEPVDAAAALVVNAVNDAPEVDGPLIRDVIEGGEIIVLDLMQGATDVDGDSLQITQGTITVNGEATVELPLGFAPILLPDMNEYTTAFSFDPAAYDFLAEGETYEIVLNYTIADGNGGSVNQIATITVTGTNNAPEVSAVVELAPVMEDGDEVIITAEQLLQHASDVDHIDELFVAGVALADDAAGSLTDNGNSTWTFVPAADFNGDVTFNYTVSDGLVEVPTSATLQVINDYADVTIENTQPAQAGQETVVQVSTITLAGTPGDIADTYTVVINGQAVFYETTGAETSLNEIANALALLVTGDFDDVVQATVQGAVITLTASEAGKGFTVEALGANATVGSDISTIIPATPQENVEFVAGQAQVSSVTIAAETIEIGDRYSVTINNTTLTYEANGTEESVADIARALRDLVEAHPDLMGVVSSKANGAVITVEAVDAGVPFDIDAAAFNASPGQFASTATLVPVAENVPAVAAQAQVSTVAFGDARYDQGDVVTVTISETDFSYAVQYGDTANTIRDALVAKINNANLPVTANGDTEAVLTLVADVAGQGFSVGSSVVDVAYVDNAELALETSDANAAVAQQATITLDEVAYDRGDIISGFINGEEFSYAVTGYEIAMFAMGSVNFAIAQQVANVINNVDGSVCAVARYDGTISITAREPGVEFSLTEVTVTDYVGTENALTVLETQANDAADAQVTEFSLTGTPDTGDVFKITIGETDYSATAALNATADDVLAQLAAAITDDLLAAVSAQVVEGKLVVTAKEPGEAFTFEQSVVNASPKANATVDSTVINAAAATASTAQVSTVKFGGTVNIGDVYTVTVNETTHSFTAAAGATLTSVLNALALRINNGDEKGVVTAVRSGSTLIVSSDIAGEAFNISATNTDDVVAVATPTPNVEGESGVAQVSRVALGEAAYDKGDTVTVTVDGATYSYNVQGVESNADIVDALVALMAGNPTVVAEKVDGQLQLTAKVPGDAFEFGSSVANVEFTNNGLTGQTTGENDEADQQVESIDVGAEQWDAGDVISGTLNGEPFSYEVTGDEADNDAIAAAVASAIQGLGQPVTVTVEGNVVVITANVAGTSFDLATVVSNTTESGNTIEFDGEVRENVQAQAQVSTVDLGTIGYDAGDVITLTVGGTEFSYTVTGEEADNSAIVQALLEQINVESCVDVTASHSAENATVLVLTANQVNAPFTVETAVLNAGISEQVASVDTSEGTDAVLPVAKVVEATLAAVGDIGDEYSFTFTDAAQNSYTVTYIVDGTEANLGGLATRIVSAINGDPAVSALVNAVVGEGLGQIRFEADVPGTAFDVTSAVKNNPAGTDDNGLAVTPTTPNSTATKQVSTITLTEGAWDVGDSFHIDVNGKAAGPCIDYTVQVGDTLASVLSALAGLINGQTATTGVSATIDVDNRQLVLTQADAADGPFNVSASIQNVAVNPTAAAEPATTQHAAAEKGAVGQVSTVTLDDGAMDAGDEITVTLTIGETDYPVTYIVKVGDTPDDVTKALATLINEAEGLDIQASGNDSVLTLTASAEGSVFGVAVGVDDYGTNDGEGFISTVDHGSVAGNESAAAKAQVSTITLNDGALDAGDVVTVTVKEQPFSYTVQVGNTFADVMGALIADINGASGLGVTASAEGAVLTLTGNDGTGAFEVTSNVANVQTHDGLGEVASATRASTAAQAAEDAKAQVSTITLGAGALDAGDVVTVTVKEQPFSYTVQVGDTFKDVMDALVADINNASALGVTASAEGAVLTLTEDDASTGGFDFSGDVQNVGQNGDATATALDTVEAATATAQQSTVTFSGLFDQGDVATVTLNGHAYSYTVQAGDNADAVVEGLIAEIDAAQEGVTLVNSGNGVLTLTESDPANGGFSVSSGVQDRPTTVNTADAAVTQAAAANVTAVAQVSTVSFDDVTGNSAVNIGDVYSVTINGVEHSYTAAAGATMITVLNALRSRINAGDEGDAVTAVRSGTKLIISADSAGVPFTVSASNTDTTAAVATPTANVVGSVASVEESSVDFGAANYDAGDTVSLTINGNTYQLTLTETLSPADLVNALVTSISSSDFSLEAGNGGQLLITGTAVNDPLNVAVDVNNVITTAASVPAVDTPVENVAADAKQVSIVTLAGDFDAGDVVTVTIGQDDYSYTVQVGDTREAIASKLAEAINDQLMGAVDVTASYSGGVLTLTAAEPGVSFDAKSSVDHASVTQGEADVDTTTENTEAVDAAPQVDTVTLSGTFDAGDVVSVTIDGKEFTHTVQVNGKGPDIIGAALAAAINDEETGAAGVQASYEEGVLTLTAEIGTTFTTISGVQQVQVSDGNADPATNDYAPEILAKAQVDTLSLSGIFDAGDVVTVTIDGKVFTHTVQLGAQDAATIGAALAAAINHAETGAAGAQASYSEGVLTLTATEAGVSFQAESVVTQAMVSEGGYSVGTTPAADAAAAVAQISTVTLSGSFDAGDVVTVTVGTEVYEHIVQVGATSVAAVGAALVDAITQGEAEVTATFDAGVLSLTGAPGVAFDVDSSVTQVQASNGGASFATGTPNVTADIAQVTAVTFNGANTIEQGDTFTLVINGQTLSYTTAGDEGLYDILSALGDEIDNASLPVNWEVVVANDGNSSGDFSLQLTAAEAGVEFTVVASATNRPAGEENLPAELIVSENNVEAVAPVQQVSTIDLGADTLDAGDEVSLTIDGVAYTYTVTGQEADNSAIVDTLVQQLSGAIAPVSAANAGGKLQLTGNANGSAFTVAAVINNIALQTNAGQVTVDDTTTPSVEAVEAVAQETAVTFDFAGGNEPGDTYRLTLELGGESDPVTVEFVTLGDETLADIAAALQDLLAQQTDAVTVTLRESVANSGVFNQMLFTAAVAGTPFTVTPGVINRPEGELNNSAPAVSEVVANVTGSEAVAQQSTITLTGADYEAGDTYRITLDADGSGELQPFTVTYVSSADETLAEIAQALQEAIDLREAPLTVTVLESEEGSGVFNQIVIEANNAGTPFTVSAEVTNRGVGANDDNDAVVEIVQENVEPQPEQAQVSLVNFQENLITGDTLYIAIDNNGVQGFDHWFSAALGEGQSVNDVLLALETQIEEADIGFTADVDGTQITLTGVPAESFTLGAGYNLQLLG